MIKQMGRYLRAHLPHLANVLIFGIIKQAKLFLSHNGNAGVDMERDEDEDGQDDGQQVHYNATKQAKACLRKGLGLVNDVYKKFGSDQDDSFIDSFSEIVFNELVQDQLAVLNPNYISSSSQLLQIICQSWPDGNPGTLNNLQRPDVIPKVFGMLTHPMISYDVIEVILGLLKKLIGDTAVEGKMDKARSRLIKE